jgi:hypothetical protein
MIRAPPRPLSASAAASPAGPAPRIAVSRASLHPTMSNAFPFNDTTSTDPLTGRSDGLLERLATRRRVPKIFFTNSSTNIGGEMPR